MRISDWSSDVCSSDLPFQSVEIGLAPSFQWLLELRDARRDEHRQQFGERADVIALIGIDADPRIRTRRADCLDARDIVGEVKIGRASGRERVCGACRSRGAPYH